MTNNAKQKAGEFLKEYRCGKVSLCVLKSILSKQGYTLVMFNNILNNENVSALITSLDLEQYACHSKCFTYTDHNRRLVFLHEDLSEQEQLVVLAHEEGHIYCKHFSSAPIIGEDVLEEYEANEFSHFILGQSIPQRVQSCFQRHKKRFAILAAAVLLLITVVVTVGIVNRERSYYGEYYITAAGQKYHEKGCIFIKDNTNVRRLTVTEFESGEYEPCRICLPPVKGVAGGSSDGD